MAGSSANKMNSPIASSADGEKGCPCPDNPSRCPSSMKRTNPAAFLPVLWGILLAAASGAAAERLNVLIITTDDMSCDSVGVYGAKLKDITPNMDRLAAQSLRFNHAY